MRILLLAGDRFPPFRVDLRTLFAKEMVERGHTIDWVLQSEEHSGISYQTEWLGCKVWVGATDNGTSMPRRLKKNLLDLLNDLRLASLLRSGKYDLIIVRDKFLSALVALFCSKIYRKNFIFWLSYPFPEDYLSQVKDGKARYPFLYWIRGHLSRLICYRIIIPHAKHTFVQTEQMRKNIASLGIPMNRMTAVPMAVSVGEIPFFGYEKPQAATEKIIVYLGTLFRVRKLDFLVRVFEKVLRKESNARLYLVGGGEDPRDEAEILAEARRLGINGRISITGFLPQEKAWEYVRDASVCVSPIRPTPTLNCGSPTKLIEYLAMGKAAVANDHPEQKVVLGESNAGICVPYQEDAFAEAVLYLLNNPREAEEMGQRGRRYIEEKRSYRQAADLVERMLLGAL